MFAAKLKMDASEEEQKKKVIQMAN